jgi:hypothetical protein
MWRPRRNALDRRTYRSPNRLKYFDDHSPTPIVVWLIVVAATGFVRRRYG